MKQPPRWPRHARLDWTFPPPYPKGLKGIKSNKLERGALQRSMDKMTCYPSVSPAHHSGTKDRGLPTKWRQFRPPRVDSSGLQQKAASAYENQAKSCKATLSRVCLPVHQQHGLNNGPGSGLKVLHIQWREDNIHLPEVIKRTGSPSSMIALGRARTLGTSSTSKQQ